MEAREILLGPFHRYGKIYSLGPKMKRPRPGTPHTQETVIRGDERFALWVPSHFHSGAVPGR